MSPVPRPWRPMSLVVLATLVSACATLSPSRSELQERVGHSDLDVGALRIRVRDLARRFSGLLEATADGLAASSDSPEMAQTMLRFKANSVPAMQGALFQPDPVAAIVDAWALLAQMEEVLPRWAEHASPELRAEALRSLRDMESQVEALWREVSGSEDVSAARTRVHAWAAEHPLTAPLVARESTVPLLASVTATSGGSLLRRAAGLVEGMTDITARVDLYAASLPRQARWQAELAAADAMNAPILQSLMAELSRTVDLLDRVGGVAANSPALIARERMAVLEALDQERRLLQDYVTGERQAVLAGVGQERAVVVDALRAERVATLQQLDGLARGWVDHAFDRAVPLVDRVFQWLLALVALGLVGGLVLVTLLIRLRRRA
ncbi:chemotaxis protein [Corallococcus llansteffanensis]|uniref:Chemotaxis protein n=1 Tax=Corallococcus llansteffanensis TaxID=2316731 RepID=A0A3A8P428_9BACT|nr:chemotaxis protein [Corallococcus llansteffanensis]RKH51063.1 chemotaxis protein [Corallococcus llansteffanensis]